MDSRKYFTHRRLTVRFSRLAVSSWFIFSYVLHSQSTVSTDLRRKGIPSSLYKVTKGVYTSSNSRWTTQGLWPLVRHYRDQFLFLAFYEDDFPHLLLRSLSILCSSPLFSLSHIPHFVCLCEYFRAAYSSFFTLYST